MGGAVHQGVVQELFTAIKKGDPDTVRSMLDAGWRIEASQALYMYLARLPDPLIPVSIQRLVLGKIFGYIGGFGIIDQVGYIFNNNKNTNNSSRSSLSSRFKIGPAAKAHPRRE